MNPTTPLWLSVARVAVAGATAFVLTKPARPAGEWQAAITVPRYLRVNGPPGDVLVQVTTAAGAAAPDGTVVNLTGSLGLQFSPSAPRTVGGLAESTAFAGSETGFAQVDATALGARAAAVLWVRPGDAARIAALTSAPSVVGPGEEVRVAARVEDAYGNPADGEPVVFTATGGLPASVTSHVERGSAMAAFTAGVGPEMEVAATVGGQTKTVHVLVTAVPGPRALVLLPWAGAASLSGCRNILANPTFETDEDANGLPDGWNVSPDGSVSLVPGGPMSSGSALRMASAAEAPLVSQSRDVAAGAKAAVLRLWLRNAGAPARLRVDVWSMSYVGDRLTRVPLLVETLDAAPEWSLAALALPAPPLGTTDVLIQPRGEEGAVAVDVARTSLEVCR